jgi:hypothetical protein
MKTTPPITRNCLICGLEKPLAAFLQISGTQGTNYGNVCSTCRNDKAKSKSQAPATEEDTGRSGGSGLRVDAKKRIYADIQQKIADRKTQEINREELDKRDQLNINKAEKSEKQSKEEKNHRDGYIENRQKKSFLQYKTNKHSLSNSSVLQQTPLATQAQAEIQQTKDKQNLEKSIDHEQKLSDIDTSQLYLDSQFGELKFQSVVFKQFKDWLGEGANFRSVERLYKTKATQKPSADAAKKETKTPFVEFETKNNKPSRGR